MIESGQRLLNDNDNINDYIWEDFPCNEWERTRIQFKSEHFHQWPHAGEISEPEENIAPSTAPLVDI